MVKNNGKRSQIHEAADPNAITVTNVNKSFRLPHNRQSSLKGTLVNLISGGDRTFETQEVLKNVSFEIKKGEFFGIVGRNGSGKSTLLKMLAGIYKPTSGEIVVNGSLTPFIELGVGFNPELTGRENVFLNGALLGFNDREVSAMYDDIVAFAELKRFMDQKLKNYSSGMQVRLAFSIAIRARSDVLLLDEVLAVGDEAFQRKCFNYFKSLKRAKKTVILVSHDMSSIQEFCTKALLIDAGEIRFVGNPLLIAAEYRLLNGEKIPENSKVDDENVPEVRGVELHFDQSIQTVTINRKETAILEGDKKAEIAIDILPKSRKAVTVGLSIVRVDDHYVAFHNTSSQLGNIPMTPSKTLKIKYDVSLMDLIEGTYRIDVATYDKDGSYVDLKTNIARFVVTGKHPDRGGILVLDGTWTING